MGPAAHLQQPAPSGRNLHREYTIIVDLELGASDGGNAGALVLLDGHGGDLNERRRTQVTGHWLRS
jgi:hypothetical protein